MTRALIAAVFAVAGLQAAQARTLAEVRQGGTLRICVAGSSADFYQANAEAFARFLGVAPEVKRLLDWDQQFQNRDGVTVKEAAYEARLLADGGCDLYPNDLHVLDWRESKMLMVPYYSARKVVLAHRDLRSLFKRPEDLAGRSAAVQKGTAYDAWLAQQNAGTYAARPVSVRHAPTAECMKMVADKAADFTLVGTEGAYKWVRSEQRDLVMLFPVDAPVAVGWGMRPSATDLAGELRRFFDESRRVGSDLDLSWQKQYNVSLVEYELRNPASDVPRLVERALPVWALSAGALVLFLLAAAAVWILRLRRELGRAANFRAGFESAGCGIIVRDREFRLTGVNRAFLDFVGYTRGELEAMPAFAVADPELREEVGRQFARLRAGEIGQYRARQRFLHKSGEARVADIVVSAVRGPRREFLASITIVNVPEGMP